MKITYNDEKILRVNIIDVREDGFVYIRIITKDKKYLLKTSIISLWKKGQDVKQEGV